MEISVFCIQKSKRENFENEIKEYAKMSSKFAKISDVVIFNDKIAKAQSKGRDEALKAYDEVYEPNLNGFCVALDEAGREFNSEEFAKLISDKAQISFFIGGAYGLSQNFKQKTDAVVSLSRMTMAHKIAKLMLYEQIFRALCINKGHPYHK